MKLVKLYADSFRGLSREVWLLSLVMLINRSGAMVLPFLGIYLNQELGFSLSQVGIIMTFFGIGSFSGSFSGGMFTDRFGFFPVQWISLLLTAFTFLQFIFFTDFYFLCFGTFLISFVADHFRPANWTAVEAFSTEENRVRSVSLIRLAVNLGYFFGPFIGGVVAGTIGYYMLFVLNASSVFIAGVVFYFLFRNKQRRSISKKNISGKISQVPWRDFHFIMFLIPFTVLIMSFMQLIYSVPLYLKSEFLFVELEIGMLMAANGLIIFIIEMPLIYILEKKYSSKVWIFIGGLFITGAYFSFLVVPIAIAAAICYTILITMGEVISFPFSSTLSLKFSNDENRGKYMGFYTMTFSMASIIAPGFGLYISDHFGFNMLWMICVVLSLFSSIWIYMLKTKHLEGEDKK